MKRNMLAALMVAMLITGCGNSDTTADSTVNPDTETETADVPEDGSPDFSGTLFMIHLKEDKYALGYELHTNVPTLDSSEWTSEEDWSYTDQMVETAQAERVKVEYDTSVFNDTDRYYLFDQPKDGYDKGWRWELCTVAISEDQLESARKSVSEMTYTIVFHHLTDGKDYTVTKNLPFVYCELDEIK